MGKRARLIYNPTSGREEMKRKLPDILQYLEEHDVETSTHATTSEGDAKLAAEKAVEREYDIIIAAGGDGTINEVVNGMAEKSFRPQLGIIPVGTTNDFARALGIPKYWKKACEIIVNEHCSALDIGRVNDKYFINIAGGGSMTELTYEVPSRLKTMLGQLAYYMKGLELLPRIKPTALKVHANEHFYEGEFMLFLISNSNSVGGFEKLAPQADLQDGLFDVILLKKCNLAEFIRVVTLALRGEHIHDDLVIHFQADEVDVQASKLTQLNLDGEYGGTLPCHFKNLREHIEFFVDPSGKSKY
ncbi:diacylglycerol kinase [Longirhabdus pacifica]|uniref:diacylglycerol kinase n=1 Tax=Longirhabdus pacifica TaxID=2305227 RepID=UPI001008C4D1|nr:diacylglycerol kinase [Longirhabdus pacifica]